MTKQSKIAIIGLGHIGTAVATNLVKGARAIIVADRNIDKAKNLSQKLGSLAEPMEIATAIKAADIIVLAIWFDAIKEVLRQYKSELAGKIIVDPSNPIAPAENGGFKKTISESESAGEIISNLLPKGARLAKALGTLGVATLSGSAFQDPKNVLFYATDDMTINSEVDQLIRDSGFEPVRLGDISQSIRLEAFGEFHEFGALGKTVTLSETKKLLEV
ncbi:MAG TPA: NAD(P)-binding domain-containing protein [Flavitalea sp.]|nr:NAD(P)-binding domain-containing protein [Flavitalea sp.]HTF30351.1 NAD(P)-binding domain-containing protein [Flavitalea sp.]